MEQAGNRGRRLRAWPRHSLSSGADHILNQQCSDGGFGWPHDDCSATHHNITAPILEGVLGAYWFSGELRFLLGGVYGGVFDLSSTFDNGEARFGTFTPRFMDHLSRASGNTAFATFAEFDLFAELDAGTYGPDDLDTAGWIAKIQDDRTGTWVNLRPWEFHTLIPAARALGVAGQDALFEQGVLDGLDTLDNTDPDNVYSDIIGLSGAVRGLAFARRFAFPPISAPLHAGVDGIDSLEDLAAYLASLQNPDGSWYWHSNLSSPTTGDEDVQTTAYAVMALMEADRYTVAPYADAAQAGRDWIVSLQLPDGGIPEYPGGDENTEVEGEAMSTIYTVDSTIFCDGFQTGDATAWSDEVP
jgi:hypothetical protein